MYVFQEKFGNTGPLYERIEVDRLNRDQGRSLICDLIFAISRPYFCHSATLFLQHCDLIFASSRSYFGCFAIYLLAVRDLTFPCCGSRITKLRSRTSVAEAFVLDFVRCVFGICEVLFLIFLGVVFGVS